MNNTFPPISSVIDSRALRIFNISAAEQEEDEKFMNAVSNYEYIFDSPSVRVFFYVVYTLVFCLCFFGNLTVMIVVALHWRMRSVTKFFMGNLAFANFCVGIFCIYQNLSTFLSENWGFGRLLCKMYYFTTSLSHTASILILVVICVERYLSIINPFQGRRILTIQRLRLTLAAVWLISAVIRSPRLYYITTFEAPLMTGPEEDYEVICAPKRTLYNSRTADMVYFVLLFVIPLIVMSILYARIGAVIWKTSAVLKSSSVGGPSQTVSNAQTPQDSASQTPKVPNNSLATSTSGGRKGSSGNSQSGRADFASSSSIASASSSSRKKSKNSWSQSHSRQSRKPEGKVKGEQHTFYNHNHHHHHHHPQGVNPVDCLPSHISQAYNNTYNNVTRHARRVSKEPQVPTRQLIQVRDERRGKVLRSRQAVIRMLIALVASFALCNFPYHLRKICQYYVPNYNVGSYFNQIFTPLTFLLMYTNCAVNPILYAFMSKTFRMSLRELVRRDYKRPRPPHNGGAARRRLSV